MIALVVPLAMTTNVEIISRNKVMTWRAILILVSMMPVQMGVGLTSCAVLGVQMGSYTDSNQTSLMNVRKSRRIVWGRLVSTRLRDFPASS